MTKTVGNAVLEARAELKDVNAGGFTYSPGDMARYCGEGVLELRRVRPSTRYDETFQVYDDDSVWAGLSEADESRALLGEDRFYPALVAYIIARCLSRDITDESNMKVAATWMGRFTALAGG